MAEKLRAVSGNFRYQRATTMTLDAGAATLLEDLRRAATPRGRAALGAFVAEGERVVRRALDAGWVPRVLVLARPHDGPEAAADELRLRVRALGRPCVEVPAQALKALADGRASGRVLALFELAERPSARQIVTGSDRDATFLVIADVRDPGNVGALLRVALASGAAAVLSAGSTDPHHPRAVRTSLGAVFKVPLAIETDAARLLGELDQLGVHCLAAVSRGGQSLDVAGWPSGRLALVVGNEGAGLAREVRERAQSRVTIDLSDQADSHSVSSAAAVCLYEIERRRRCEARSR